MSYPIYFDIDNHFFEQYFRIAIIIFGIRMKNNVKGLILATLFIVLNTSILLSQIAKTQVVMAEIQLVDNSMKLVWDVPNGFSSKHRIYKRNLFDWGKSFTYVNEFDENTSEYILSPEEQNESLEWLINRVDASDNIVSLGYIASASNYKPDINRGWVHLLIDSTYSTPLSDELVSLRSQLRAMGYTVTYNLANRNSTPFEVKEELMDSIYSMKTKVGTNLKAIYIIGHVPVPYSGYFSSTGHRYPPDGHAEGSGNHTGAWPADCYYGDFDGSWTDTRVNCTTGNQNRHHNEPGDGKFDASVIIGTGTEGTWSPVEIEVGRVDFYDMPAFADSDTSLLKDYLDRCSDWRNGKIKVINHALIDNNFGSLNLASSGYQNFPCFVGIDSVFDDRDYFTSQNSTNYLWSYGCGAGSYKSCNGIGTTNNFASNKGRFSNAFTMLAGSYFGDWDSQNNFLRAALAGGSLATFWGGIPKWYVHHMALGANIGLGAWLTMNNSSEYFNGFFNGSAQGVHIALMGDPTLTLAPPKPIQNLSAKSVNGNVELNWDVPVDENVSYYKVFTLKDESFNNFNIETLVHSEDEGISITNKYIDESNWVSGNYKYAVAAVRIDTTGSGSYHNYSKISIIEVQHINSVKNPVSIDLKVMPNPTSGILNIDCNYEINGYEIIDITGRKLMTGGLNNSNQTISLKSSMAEGIYFLRIKTINGSKTIQFELSKP